MPPEPRLATHMVVSALVRQLSANGDAATVLRKGDPIAGTLLLVTRCRGRNPAVFEPISALDGSRKWQPIFDQDIDSEQEIDDYLERRLARDPDIWVLELDVAFAERLTGLLGPRG
jgi:hypothetical protein